jgi:hypothetical protein
LGLDEYRFGEEGRPETVEALVEAVKKLDEISVDFILIDEVHSAKQRFADHMSKRKRLIQALVARAAEANPELRVLSLSATPVINNLQEGRSLVEMITGIEHDDIDVKPTVHNCMRLHQKMMTLGTRWRPEYSAVLDIETCEVDCADLCGRNPRTRKEQLAA